MKTLKEKLADNILFMMKQQGRTKTELCQLAGIGHAELSKMATNPQRITVIFLLKICRGLGCAYSNLFNYNGKMLPNLEIGSAYLQRIKARRKELGKSEREAAGDLKIRQSTYKNFEAGICGMDPVKFDLLLWILEITPDYLSGKREPAQGNGQKDEMTNLFTFERDEEYRKLEEEVKALRKKLTEAEEVIEKTKESVSAAWDTLCGE